MQRVATVSGANKGIGFEVVRKIGHEQGWLCVLTARDEGRGRKAAETLLSEGAGVRFRQLDVTDSESRANFVRQTEQEFGKIDAHVNNAGFAFKGADPTPFKEQAEKTMHINFFSTVELTEAVLPLVKKSDAGRIVNVASMSGHLKILKSEELKKRFASAGQPNGMQQEELMQLAHQFVADVKAGKHAEAGWPDSCYGVSKLCLIAYTKILAAREPSLRINCCCPGFCKSDMTGHNEKARPAEEGARTPYMLAVKLADDDATGKFFQDEKEIQW